MKLKTQEIMDKIHEFGSLRKQEGGIKKFDLRNSNHFSLLTKSQEVLNDIYRELEKMVEVTNEHHSNV